eukprot:scaffold68026_cov18-Tisochrysis_lutea.AAC.1
MEAVVLLWSACCARQVLVEMLIFASGLVLIGMLTFASAKCCCGGAKCVLREVCILRRLYHPNICALKDAFLRPSSTGGFVLRDGNFVAKSVDLYCVLEYCDHGGFR